LVIDRTIIFNLEVFYAQSLEIAITEIGKVKGVRSCFLHFFKKQDLTPFTPLRNGEACSWLGENCRKYSLTKGFFPYINKTNTNHIVNKSKETLFIPSSFST
jgi:hypothetical protein